MLKKILKLFHKSSLLGSIITLVIGSLLGLCVGYWQYHYTIEKNSKQRTIANYYNQLRDDLNRVSLFYEMLVDGRCLKISAMNETFFYSVKMKYADSLLNLLRDHDNMRKVNLITVGLSRKVVNFIYYNNQFLKWVCKMPNFRHDKQQDKLIINLKYELALERNRLLNRPFNILYN